MKMNNLKLAERIIDCISDGYDDEEYREEATEQLDITPSYIVDVIKKLCERIEELET